MKVASWEVREDETLWGPWRTDLALAAVLDAARNKGAARVMLTGDCPPRNWFMQDTYAWSNTRVFFDHENPAARYRHASGFDVEIRRAAEWFGAGDYTHQDAQSAWLVTRQALAASGRTSAAMFRSPGATGVDLWLRTMKGDVPEPVSVDMQELLRATSPQHRIELFEPKQDMMPALWIIDGRWMYAALTKELGATPARFLTAAEAEERADKEPYARGRYHVRFTAPSWWIEVGFPGLLLSTAGENPGDGWHAPLAGVTWCDAAELLLARRYEWRVEFLGGIAYDNARPLDTWTTRLIRARESLENKDDTPSVLARGAVRSIMLHAIGSFHAAGRKEHVITGSPMTRPPGDDWEPPQVLDDNKALWTRAPRNASARIESLRHPEWSSGVWGRAHARIVECTDGNGRRAGAIAVPPQTLVSIYGDAISVTTLPEWARNDDGAIGRLRVKGHLCGPIPWPRSARERDEQTRLASAAGTQCTKGCK